MSDRASLAEQLKANPLFDELFDRVEREAVEAMIAAETNKLRAENAFRIQAIRSLRHDCEAFLRSTRERKAAPA